MVQQHGRRPEGATALTVSLSAMSNAEPWIGSNTEGRLPRRVQVRDRFNTQAPGKHGGRVRQDVGGQIRGYYDMQSIGLQHYTCGHCVDQLTVGRNVEILARHFIEDLVPHHPAESLGVRLGDQREPFARAREFVSKPVNALCPGTGEYCRHGSRLNRQHAMRAPTISSEFTSYEREYRKRPAMAS